MQGARLRLADLPEPKLAALAPRVRGLAVSGGELQLHLAPEASP
jgi:hypothetical protein